MSTYGFWFYPYWYCLWQVCSLWSLLFILFITRRACGFSQSRTKTEWIAVLGYDPMYAIWPIIWHQSKQSNDTSLLIQPSSCQILSFDCKWLVRFGCLDDLGYLCLIIYRILPYISCQPHINGTLTMNWEVAPKHTFPSMNIGISPRFINWGFGCFWHILNQWWRNPLIPYCPFVSD